MSSSVTPTSRLDRLNGLSHAIAQHRGRTDAFKALDLQDRTRILAKLHIKEFDWTTIEKKGLKGRITKELQTMTKELRALSMQPPALTYSFPFSKAPKDVMTTILGSYLTGQDLVAFHGSFKAASEFQSASHIINHYGLAPLIETYLHRSCATFTEFDKAKALDALMTFAYNLSEIEELPRPSYSSLSQFFELVEARNLIRMMEKIHQHYPFPDLPKGVKNLKIPKDAQWTVLKAKRLRHWMKQHEEFLGAINQLDLRECRLSLLPKEIGQLKALQVLELDSNSLASVAKEIGRLQALQGLALSNNRLASVPKEIGQLKALQTLYLERNRLASVPKEIGQLQALQWLDLGSNHLASVPKEIGQLQALQVLGLGGNRLASVPKEIGQLQALQWLMLDNNHLASVPKEIGQLQALQWLVLGGNRLVNLPKGLERFSDQLESQNKKLQLKTLLDQMMLCLKDKHDCKGIASLIAKTKKILGKKVRSKLELALYEICKKESKTNSKLQAKLKDPKFQQRAFTDKEVDPTYKAMAIAQFWKANKK